jgi:hypothetical protein
MKQSLILPLLMLNSIAVLAQDDTTTAVKKAIPSMATIKTMDGNSIKGWFYAMDSNRVYLLSNLNKIQQPALDIKSPRLNNVDYKLPAANINTITLKKKHAGLKGTLIGLGAGIVVGAVIGFASGDDKIAPYTGVALNDLFIGMGNAFAMTAGEKALGAGLGLGFTGAIVGCIIGNVVKKKFTIGGRKEIYHDLQYELMQRLIIK